MTEVRFWRDSSGRLTFDLFHVQATDYPAVCRAVADAFVLTPSADFVLGLEAMFWEFRRAEQSVALDWDIWMGFMVAAQTEAAEPLVRDIAGWLASSAWATAEEPQPAREETLECRPDEE